MNHHAEFTRHPGRPWACRTCGTLTGPTWQDKAKHHAWWTAQVEAARQARIKALQHNEIEKVSA